MAARQNSVYSHFYTVTHNNMRIISNFVTTKNIIFLRLILFCSYQRSVNTVQALESVYRFQLDYAEYQLIARSLEKLIHFRFNDHEGQEALLVVSNGIICIFLEKSKIF